jgi:hypothetical protein
VTTLQIKVANTGLKIWKGRTPSQMTDDECREFLDFMWRRLGVLYI